ncbi:MAG: photosystem I assembly BtpA [Tenericutes bacterium HGW-Tenericutes-1]|jgi:hypothetical protein|nr:MAG: photosystem I assembly BtpA [Tenericutes bacterium HGW-Tenericutes-1]PKM57006.1 MAG: photosystem I assembly BtpA [Firmicutes bacterium HGW-Firmicutes-3]
MNQNNVIGLNKKTVIGMVHCLPLPGSAGFQNNMNEIRVQAIEDAITLEKAGCDALIVENMGDGPFSVFLNTEQIAALSSIATLVKEKVSIPIGIDAAFSDYKASLAIAKAIEADFVRIPVFVDTVMFYGGTIEPCARETLLYRKQLNADNILILADIQVKHTYMINPSISIEDSAHMAEKCGADAIIVTGASIGAETPFDIIERVKKVVSIPVIAGSGIKPSNIKKQLSLADGCVVGSSLKENGIISNPVSYDLTKKVIDALRKGE